MHFALASTVTSDADVLMCLDLQADDRGGCVERRRETRLLMRPSKFLFFIPGFMQSLPGSVATGRANGGHEGAEARADLLNCRSRGVEISWASRFSSEGSCRQQ